MEFRAEFFNIFNHPTMGTPVGTISNPSGGPVGSTTFGLPVASTTQPATPSTEREMQFGVRFVF
jgi:hypothetical protein